VKASIGMPAVVETAVVTSLSGPATSATTRCPAVAVSAAGTLTVRSTGVSSSSYR
jgi:hypothetical protein